MRNLVTESTWELVVGGRTPELMPKFTEEEAAIRTAKAKVIYDIKKAAAITINN